eukprot:TRINITY_DN1220_c0_g1_i1.p1 TRINITY_DN1220_c0_g1~~TRINITY_DN1220_c0_g1_i1.p1  ORF type:complete len:561 (-),score=105.56 TRINITY_DN1220_c0_g1_i1:1373-3055(-)
MILTSKSKAKKHVTVQPSEQKFVTKVPKLEDYIKSRDWTGAVCLLEWQKNTSQANKMTLLWLAYCAFHKGDYKRALAVYQDLLKRSDADPNFHLYAACCYYYEDQFKEAEAEALKGPNNKFQTRILMHCAHKLADDKKADQYAEKVGDTIEDQLSVASLHYLRRHYQEAVDVYKRLLMEYRDYFALQVYVALCYYKLDFYDVSLEILTHYLQSHPDSATAINLKACNQYKLYDGKAAEAELKVMTDLLSSSSTQSMDHDLVKHNLVVFRNGENAMQMLPPLIDIITPEARLNLVIYHLRNHDLLNAYDLMKNLAPMTPQEYILKGVVNAAYAQARDSKEHLANAKNFYHLIGYSDSERDTIPGRQCMASFYFLMHEFPDVLVYLNSIKQYCAQDPVFLYNYGLALAFCEYYKEAEEALVQLQNDENFKGDYSFLSCLTRCFIMNSKPREAWEVYLRMESSNDSFTLLQLIANDCYKVGHFYYSAKAFDVLERIDPRVSEYWDGKRGACCGLFQQVIARVEKKECLRDIVQMLRNKANNPQAELMIRVMKKWGNENQVNLN